MPGERLLLDTDVIVAAVVDTHVHHEPSLAIFDQESARICVAAHSYAEAFNTLTRRGDHAPFRRSPEDSWAALESVAAASELVGLTPAQTFDAVRSFAAMGGIGARLFDFLIGRAATLAGADTIITWNTRHFRSLFADRRIETPKEFLARRDAISDGENAD